MAGSQRVTFEAHRFAPAAPDEEYVYGACCPGWHSTAEQEEGIEEWIEFMRDRGIERVCCLLSGDQLDGTAAKTCPVRPMPARQWTTTGSRRCTAVERKGRIRFRNVVSSARW